MDYSEIFVRFGEIALKSPSVRHRMEKRLASNIRKFLKKIDLPNSLVSIKRSWGRLVITLEAEELQKAGLTSTNVAQLLAENVCGIVSTSPVYRTPLTELEKVALSLAEEKLQQNSSFAVRVRRFGTHNFTSKDVEAKIGGIIHEKFKDRGISVNLTRPDYLLQIEIKNELAFVFDTTFRGYGGFPQGGQGTIAAILRGSLEDAIAAFLLCKRGAIIIPLTFEVENFAGKFSNVEELQKQLTFFARIQPTKGHYFKVNFDNLLEKIGIENITCSICDKVCLGIANRIIEGQHKKGIVLGNAEDAILHRNPETAKPPQPPIYYPLIALDKETIRHPFNERKFQSGFCLNDCPGYQKQKRKKGKQLSDAKIAKIVASAEFELVTPALESPR
ncbi:MAG: THUMP domain-containing protein [Candidatus Heimdallarchaeota archaeon]|nr:THUMP domain-containing protein [Candidatus Heimdallarchaeota archaeon]